MINPVRNINNVTLTDVEEAGKKLKDKGVDLDKETLERFEKANNPDIPFRQRFREFLRAENDLGKAARLVKHGLILLTPFGKSVKTVTEFGEQILLPESQQTEKPMLAKVLSIKNFINLRDENGNFSWSELGASVLQLVIAGALVWGAQELGIWKGLMNLLQQ